ncbi:MAG: S41 family peptidase [Pseudomonadota bacterium]
MGKQGRALVAMIGGLFWATAAAQPAQDRELDAAAMLADVDLAEEAYSRIHPGYTRYASTDDMAFAWQSLRTQINDGKITTVGDFYLGIEEALVPIRCDHTKAELPKALRDERDTARVYLPFRWVWVEGRAIVLDPGSATGLSAGDEVMALDGKPIAHIVEETQRFIPVDGYTDWARSGQVPDSLEFPGGAVDHFGALLEWPEPRVSVTAISATGQEKREVVSRLTFQELRALRAQNSLATDFKNAVTFERIGERAALLRIDTFVNYRYPVKPDDLYAPIFKALKREGRDSLILDLRRNGGGSGDAQMGLLAYLINEKLRLYTDMRVATLDLDGVREHLWTWDSRALNPNRAGFRSNDDGTYSLRRFVSEDLKEIRPKRDRFDGRLFVLISADNSSASTTLSAFLDAHTDAVLVGEETGGSSEGPTAGLLFTLTLPQSGIKTRVPFFRYYNNVPNPRPGFGVAPDVEAKQTVASIRAGTDPAKEAALSLVADQ